MVTSNRRSERSSRATTTAPAAHRVGQVGLDEAAAVGAPRVAPVLGEPERARSPRVAPGRKRLPIADQHPHRRAGRRHRRGRSARDNVVRGRRARRDRSPGRPGEPRRRRRRGAGDRGVTRRPSAASSRRFGWPRVGCRCRPTTGTCPRRAVWVAFTRRWRRGTSTPTGRVSSRSSSRCARRRWPTRSSRRSRSPRQRRSRRCGKRTRVLLSRISPDLVRERAKRARASTGLRRWVAEPGVDEWHGTFPSEDAATAWAAIDRLAHELVAPAPARTSSRPRQGPHRTRNRQHDRRRAVVRPSRPNRQSSLRCGRSHRSSTPPVTLEGGPTPVHKLGRPPPRSSISPWRQAPATPGPDNHPPGPPPHRNSSRPRRLPPQRTTPHHGHQHSAARWRQQPDRGPGGASAEPLLVRRAWLRDHMAKAPPGPRPAPQRARPKFVPCDPSPVRDSTRATPARPTPTDLAPSSQPCPRPGRSLPLPRLLGGRPVLRPRPRAALADRPHPAATCCGWPAAPPDQATTRMARAPGT